MPNAQCHLVLIVGITAVCVLAIAQPFLPGRFDSLAVPVSTLVQVLGIVGLPLSLIGLLWMAMPKRGFLFGAASAAYGVFLALVLALFAALSVGYTFGVFMLAAWTVIFIGLIPKLKRLKNPEQGSINPIPWYLVAIPVCLMAFQWAFAEKAAQRSRERVMDNAAELIGDIEAYHARNGRYPESMQALWPDYWAGTVGVAQYHYEPHGDSYNLAFEQPRFLVDDFGTREFVVYNPRGSHSMVSHAAWRLSNPGLGGWYASGET